MADFDFTPEHRAYFDELRLAVQDAQNNPDHWDQSHWHCQTSHCIAGFGDMRRNGLAPQDEFPKDKPEIAQFAFDYPYWRVKAEIFASTNSMATILECLENIRVNGFEYNRDGYDRSGYDKDGYNESGYNRDGYNRDGYGFVPLHKPKQ
jgi:hypothetical protein